MATEIKKKPHHERRELCTTRPLYRQGNKLTAVKVELQAGFDLYVYTVNEESQHLLISGVPAVNLRRELKQMCLRYGELKSIQKVENFSEQEEQFTEVFHVAYKRIQSARFAKHIIDDKSFFGGVLHVCYAPELETLAETRMKLDQRRWDIAKRIRNNAKTSQSAAGEKKQSEKVEDPMPCSSRSIQDTNKIEPVYRPPQNTCVKAGLIESRFIPKTKYDPSTNVPDSSTPRGRSTNSSMPTDSGNQSGICGKSSVPDSSQLSKRVLPYSDKFIPRQVKRIRFNSK